ncbi:hypothetical protein JCM8547_000092 [Rhodosporidiobolus lusitaniae]
MVKTKEGGDRLLAMVRCLGWDGGRPGAPWWSDARLHDALDVFLDVLEQSRRLEIVAMSSVDVSTAERALAGLSSSPSIRRLKRVHLDGTFGDWRERPGLTEDDLVRVLQSLSPLSSLVLDPRLLPPAPSSSSHTNPSLSISSLNIDTVHLKHLPDVFLPGSARYSFSSSLDASTLVEVAIPFSDESLGWLTWVGRTVLPSLRNLTIYGGWSSASWALPILSSCLSQQPQLHRLVIRPFDYTDIGIGPEDGPAYSAFLSSLPPGLNTLALLFACPIGPILDACLAQAASKSLRYFQSGRPRHGKGFHGREYYEVTGKWVELEPKERRFSPFESVLPWEWK